MPDAERALVNMEQEIARMTGALSGATGTTPAQQPAGEASGGVLNEAPSRSRSAYLPDDCSECPVCSQPVLGFGWCPGCSNRFNALLSKGSGRAALEEKG